VFDPTIFDNLKTVLEGEVYDLDLQGLILVTDRNDLINLAKLKREYQIMFTKKNTNLQALLVTIDLSAELNDLAGELIGEELISTKNLGAVIYVNFLLENIENISEDMVREINVILINIWGGRPKIEFTTCYTIYNNQRKLSKLKITLDFQRKINEGHISDLKKLVALSYQSMIDIYPLI